MSGDVPVIAIDGPTASGKGAVAERVADALGWHYLDSGALYRLVALYAIWNQCPLDDAGRLEMLARRLPVTFEGGRVRLEDVDVTAEIRAPRISEAASRIAVLPGVRGALLVRQREFRLPPGLVADGRDMATVVFADAPLKVFLTASLQVRAARRYKQLIEKGFSANITNLLEDIERRDARDAGREVAPLRPASDSVVVDSSDMSLEESIRRVLDLAVDRGLIGAD